MKYSFTFIIGYRHMPDRLTNLRRTIDWVNAFSGSQIILVEQDKHSKISNLNLKCQHIFTKSTLPFNKSWAFNVGMKYAKSDIIIFGDSDIIMDPNDFIRGINEISNYEMVSPYNSVVDLTPEETSRAIENIVTINRAGRGENDNQKINICGGICLFRREAIEKIGGWDEKRFIGWGAEDDFQSLKVKNFLTFKEIEGRCFHLYHSRQTIIPEYYNKSLQFLQKATEMTKEQLKSYIDNNSKSLGMKNLFS